MAAVGRAASVFGVRIYLNWILDNNKFLAWHRLERFPTSHFIFVSREILKEIKQSGEIHLVLDCDFEKVDIFW